MANVIECRILHAKAESAFASHKIESTECHILHYNMLHKQIEQLIVRSNISMHISAVHLGYHIHYKETARCRDNQEVSICSVY